MVLGGFLVFVRGRVPLERGPRPGRTALDERLHDLGFRGGGGRWEGRTWGRPVRITVLDDPHSDPPVVLEVSTPVPTGDLAVHIDESEHSAQEVLTKRLGDHAFDEWFE